MTEDNPKDVLNAEEVKAWLAIRKEAGKHIDPETAKVSWAYEYTLDPYGLRGELPEEEQQVGREYFACSPDSDVWVWFGDLPKETRDALWAKHRRKLAFPAGLPENFFNRKDATGDVTT